jgi:hypothetical protein
MAIGVFFLTAIIVIAFVVTSRTSSLNANSARNTTFANSPFVSQITDVNQAVLQKVGTGDLANPLKLISGQPPLQGPGGHPEFFYVGGEYCPYCAAERWAMVNALSRFGTFGDLNTMQSYENKISTFSFYQSNYTSQYIDFVPVELYGNSADNTGNYPLLQQFQGNEEQLFSTYDSANYLQGDQNIPFIDINNQYFSQGSAYSPTVLLDNSKNPFSWQDIVNSLSDPTSPITKGILGTANYLTAAICSVNGQQPGSVCNVPDIQQIEPMLSSTSNMAGGSLQTFSPANPSELTSFWQLCALISFSLLFYRNNF